MTVTLPNPSSINADDHMFDSFGHNETEVSAGWIVRYMQEREQAGDVWPSFTFEQIEEFYSRSGKLSDFWFNKLLTGYSDDRQSTEYITVNDDGSFSVTLTFIASCPLKS